MNILKFKLKFLRSLSTYEKCSNKKKPTDNFYITVTYMKNFLHTNYLRQDLKTEQLNV